MVLVRFLLLAAIPAAAQEFSLQIGNPVAANAPVLKTAGLAVRLQNCPDPSKARLTARAVHRPNSTRVTIPLTVAPAQAAGVFALGSPPARVAGAWLAVIEAECGAARAGALVPFDANSVYNRDKTRLLPHTPTEAEIETALKELP